MNSKPAPGPVEKVIQEKLASILTPSHMDILNESPQHGLPASAEKHFRLVIVSEIFKGLGRIERHRHVHTVLAEELKTHVHAISVQAFTPEEWRARDGAVTESPACLGGGKKHGFS